MALQKEMNHERFWWGRPITRPISEITEQSFYLLRRRLCSLRQVQRIEPGEMARTFNCGVGIVLAVDPVVAMPLMERLANEGEDAFVIGELAAA